MNTSPVRATNPIRILHVVGGMNRGGVETWLMHVLRHINRDQYCMDFMVHTTQPCAYDDEIHALGSTIVPCLYPSHPWLYARNFKHILRERGPYDIVHSHVHHYSGYVLRLAQQMGVPRRIAHSHNDSSPIQAKARVMRRGYYRLMERWITGYATVGLAASRQAAADLFGQAWHRDSRWRVLYYGIDLTPFHEPVDPIAVRTELGIPPDAFVVGHVGRFAEQKNHSFLVKVAAELVKREPRTCLLLIGSGELRPLIEQEVAKAGLCKQVIFLDAQPGIPRLMRSAMDVFLFPSLYEGLGLVLIEAQAAGRPCIFSDSIPHEADIVTPLLRRMALSQPASEWAKAVLEVRASQLNVAQPDALAMVEQSSFHIEMSVKQLEEVYNGTLTSQAAVPSEGLVSRISFDQ